MNFEEQNNCQTICLNQNFAHISNIEEYKQLYENSIKNPQKFWSKIAQQFEWKNNTGSNEENIIFNYNFDTNNGPIGVEFMKGTQTNVSYNLIDRNVNLGFGQRIAYHWIGHEFHLKKSLTYSELKQKVCKFANVLIALGIKKGESVINYLPNLLECVISMLACARIGVIFANVFPGYSAQNLAERMLDLKCKVLVTSDVYYCYKKFPNLKAFSDEAIRICSENNHRINARILVKYLSDQNYCQQNESDFIFDLNPEFDHWWDELMEKASEEECPPVWLDAEEPLFVVFSRYHGSTGKQKAIVHTSGGLMVYSATVFKYAFNYRDGDVVHCSGCLGWITGQFCHVFGSLANGATVVLSDGSQLHPDAGRWWRIIDEYKVNIFYVNPTDIRNLRSYGNQYVNRYEMKDLKVIGVVGETIDRETWFWLFDVVGGGRCPIVDTYFQSESGCPIIFPIPGCIPMKPGSISLPFFGIEPAILNENGDQMDGQCSGTLVIKNGWPSLARTLYGDYELYEKSYFQKYAKYYFTGDGAIRDKDGYIWITGRVDDMINTYSLLISANEVESAIFGCSQIAEVAAVPIPDPITGLHICCFVVMKTQFCFNREIESILKQKVIEKIGVVGIPKYIYSVRALPKNRSGKILRRLLAKIVKNDSDLGDISSVTDMALIEEISNIFIENSFSNK